MAFVKVMVHSVWGTKNRMPFLTKEIRLIVIEHIRSNAVKKGIFIDTIGGDTDHLHCLFGLNADMSVAKVLQLIKGESAFWINSQKITQLKFAWADEYFASSVSEANLPIVRAYINNQEEHHRSKSFQEECEGILKELRLGNHG
jgi:putative transposase